MFTEDFVNMQQMMNVSVKFVYTRVVLTEINTTGETTQHDATIQYLVIIVFQQKWGAARYFLHNQSIHSSDWYIQFP
jgi:hypothetical protein